MALHDVSVTGAGNGTNALALSAMTTGGANRFILVWVHVSNTSAVSSITGGSLTFKKIGSTVSLASNGQIELWCAQASTTLTSTVFTVNTSGFPQITATASAFSGTLLTGESGSGAIGAINTNFSGGASSISAALTTIGTNSLVVAGGGATNSGILSAGTGQTLNTTPATVSSFSTCAADRQNSATASSGSSVTGSLNNTSFGAIGIFVVELLDAGTSLIALGNTANDASVQTNSSDRKYATSFTPASSGVLNDGVARVFLSAAGTSACRLMIYSDSAGAPSTLLAVSDIVTISNTSEAAVPFTFSGVNKINLASGTPYWPGIHFQDPGTPNFTISRANTGVNVVASNSDVWSDGTDSAFGAVTQSNGPLNLYVNYLEPTPVVGGNNNNFFSFV